MTVSEDLREGVALGIQFERTRFVDSLHMFLTPIIEQAEQTGNFDPTEILTGVLDMAGTQLEAPIPTFEQVRDMTEQGAKWAERNDG